MRLGRRREDEDGKVLGEEIYIFVSRLVTICTRGLEEKIPRLAIVSIFAKDCTYFEGIGLEIWYMNAFDST